MLGINASTKLGGIAVDQQGMSASQFGSKSSNYLTSAVHATGADLERLKAIAGQVRPARVLDLGCGAGHVSFPLAEGGANRVTAYDPSREMLAALEAVFAALPKKAREYFQIGPGNSFVADSAWIEGG
jgi:predicted RNA methylase